jgi:hypothetical protein
MIIIPRTSEDGIKGRLDWAASIKPQFSLTAAKAKGEKLGK